MKKHHHSHIFAGKPWFVIAFLHISFVVAFFGSVVFFANQAQSSSIVTLGNDACAPAKDIFAELSGTYKDMRPRVDKAIRNTPNGMGRFWKITKQDHAPSYLLGTMHLTDERVAQLPRHIQKAYDNADGIVIETLDVLDPQKQLAFLAQNPQLTRLEAGKTLFDYLNDDEEGVLRSQFSKRGIPLNSIKTMRPWLYASMVSLPECELTRVNQGAKFLDMRLGLDAQKAGRNVYGLETIADQARAINSQSIDDQVDGLVQLAKLGPMVDNIFESMMQFYLRGEIAGIMPMLEVLTEKLLPNEPDVDQTMFEEIVLTKRNHVMAKRSQELMNNAPDKGFFIAVGALHLPGKDGVIALLQKDGFKVVRVPQ